MLLLNQRKKMLKKITLGFVIGMCGTFSYAAPPGPGGNTDSILLAIKTDTDAILARVNDLPSYLNALSAFCLNWTNPDNTAETAGLQASFANLQNVVATNQAAKISLQNNLIQDYLLTSGIQTTGNNGNKIINLPNVNDIFFQSLLSDGKNMILPVRPDPLNQDSNKIAYNYIKNASGMNMTHVIPSLTWAGYPDAQQRYKNYYSAINAVQTYNGYVLSQLYADAMNNNQLTAQQNALMQQASDSSNWFAKVASENLGVVLRQILMYNSQMYVLIIQLLQVQKQQLAEQAMSNTLLIIGNQFTETQLLEKAVRK